MTPQTPHSQRTSSALGGVILMKRGSWSVVVPALEQAPVVLPPAGLAQNPALEPPSPCGCTCVLIGARHAQSLSGSLVCVPLGPGLDSVVFALLVGTVLFAPLASGLKSSWCPSPLAPRP